MSSVLTLFALVGVVCLFTALLVILGDGLCDNTPTEPETWYYEGGYELQRREIEHHLPLHTCEHRPVTYDFKRLHIQHPGA